MTTRQAFTTSTALLAGSFLGLYLFRRDLGLLSFTLPLVAGLGASYMVRVLWGALRERPMLLALTCVIWGLIVFKLMPGAATWLLSLP